MLPGLGPRHNLLRAASGQAYHPVPLFPGARNPYQFSKSFAKGSGLPSFVQMHFLTAALKALEPRIDDDFVDRMNYYYSSTLIIMFAILVSAKQYVGHPIECWVPAQFTKAMEQYTENFCWIQNTYWVPFSDVVPQRIEDREHRQIGYYQWVPFILALEALMFYIPASLWRMLSSQSGINVTGILELSTDDRNIDPDNRMHTIDILSRHIDDALRYQRDFGDRRKSVYLFAFVRLGKMYGAYVASLYCFVKLLYLINVVGQFIMLNRFLETADYPFFGAHVVWDLFKGTEWLYSGKFPRVTLCDFDIRVLGNIHRHTVQCVLVINMFTEKIFIFLWIWFIILSIANTVNMLFYVTTLLVPSLRISFIYKCLELSDAPPDRLKDRKHLRRFVLHFLRPDGVFILRLVASHSGAITSTELVYSLWLRYREAQKLPRLCHEQMYFAGSGAGVGVGIDPADLVEDRRRFSKSSDSLRFGAPPTSSPDDDPAPTRTIREPATAPYGAAPAPHRKESRPLDGAAAAEKNANDLWLSLRKPSLVSFKSQKKASTGSVVVSPERLRTPPSPIMENEPAKRRLNGADFDDTEI